MNDSRKILTWSLSYRELTKDVEEEQRKRYEALKIPAKPVKEIDYSSLVKEKKKPGSVWGKPAVAVSTHASTIKEEKFPSLPRTTKPLTINGKLPVISSKKTVLRAPLSKSATPSPMAAVSDEAVSPTEEKPVNARFYTPPLPSIARANSTGSNWGVKKPDQFDIAVENALKQKAEQKKKGKGNRGVILSF